MAHQSGRWPQSTQSGRQIQNASPVGEEPIKTHAPSFSLSLSLSFSHSLSLFQSCPVSFQLFFDQAFPCVARFRYVFPWIIRLFFSPLFTVDI